MKDESQFKLQAFLDGEMGAAEAAEVKAWVTKDREAQALSNELNSTKMLLRGNECEHKLPESKEFFWSKIERDIDRLEREGARPTSKPFLFRLRKWLVPVSVVAMLVCLMLPLRPSLFSAASLASLNGIEIESSVPDSSVITFHSDTEGLSVVWVDTQLDTQ